LTPGAANVVYGGPADLSVTDTTVENQLWNQAGAIEGGLENGDRSGHSVIAGDFNGDGFDDLVFGSPGGWSWCPRGSSMNLEPIPSAVFF